MSELSEKILKTVSEKAFINTFELANIYKEDHQKIVGALKSIEAHGNLLNVEPCNEKRFDLTDEGKLIIEHGK